MNFSEVNLNSLIEKLSNEELKRIYLIYVGNDRQEGKYLYRLLPDTITTTKNWGNGRVDVQRMDTPNKEAWTVSIKNGKIPFALVNGQVTDLEAEDLFTGACYNIWLEEIKPFCGFSDQRIKSQRSEWAEQKLEKEQWFKHQDDSAQDAARYTWTTSEYNNPKPNSNKGNTMNKIEKVKDKNVTAAKGAAMIAAGSMLNKTIKSKIKPQLPMMVRGYADHALADVVIANVFSFIAENYLKGDTKTKAEMASEAMLNAAMVDLVNSFNLEKMVEDILSSVELPSTEE